MSQNSDALNDILVVLFNRILAIEEEVVGSIISKRCPEPLTMTEVHVLEAIGVGEPKSMTEIASRLGITLGSLTSSINRLVKKGYVTRLRPEQDRRVVQATLTDSGRLAYEIHDRFHRQMVDNIFSGIGPDDQLAIMRAASKLSEFFSKVEPIDILTASCEDAGLSDRSSR